MHTGKHFLLTSLCLLAIGIFSSSIHKSRVNETTQFVEHNGVRIAYKEVGKGDTTLVFIHGSFIDKTYWDEQIAHFSPSYRVIALDLASHGESGTNRNSWSIQDFGGDVAAVLQKLDLKKVVLIGHSLGADAMLEAAIAQPDRIAGLIGVDYFKNVGVALPAPMQQQIIANLQKDFPATSEAYARQSLLTSKTDSTITKRIINAYRNAPAEMGQQSIKSLFEYTQREKELLQQLKWKLHLVNVAYVPTKEAPLKRWAARGYQLITIKGSCHFPMLENDNALNDALQSSLLSLNSR